MTEISSSRTFAIAFFVGLGFVVCGLLHSIQPSFYPTEAEKKGATPSQYGFVFGIFHMAAFISASLFGRYGSTIGPKLIYITGIFAQAIVTICFGCLDFVDDTATFLGLSYTLRFIGGAADAAGLGSIVSILMELYPKYVSSIIPWAEIFLGLGYMLGPAVGSAVYGLGGFYLPFVSIGSVAFVISIALLIVVPNAKTEKKNETNEGNPLTFSGLFKNPTIFLPFVDNFICYCGNGMIESMLEPYLKNNAEATQIDVGLTFLVLGGCYMLAKPIIGFIWDKIRYPTIISIIGNSFLVTAFVLIGPISCTSFTPSVPSIQGAVAICGLGFEMVLVSTFERSQKAAIRNGYNNDIYTYFIISGVWTSSFFLGNFVGPTTAGILVGEFGFQKTTMFFLLLYVFILIVDLSELIHICAKAPEKEDIN